MSESIEVPVAQDAGIFAAPPVLPPVASLETTPLAPTSWAQIQAAHRNARKTVRIPMRADLVDDLAVLEEQLRHEEEIDRWENRDPVAPQIARRIQQVEAQVRESEVPFVFQGLGRGQAAKLQAQHPATEQVKKDLGNDDLEWNPETFPPALLAASCLEPAELVGNVAAWQEIHSTWSTGQVMPLWGACLSVNFMGAGVDSPKSVRASEILRRVDSESNSITASR